MLTPREEAQMNILSRYLIRQAAKKAPKGTRRRTDAAPVIKKFDMTGQVPGEKSVPALSGQDRGKRALKNGGWGRERPWKQR